MSVPILEVPWPSPNLSQNARIHWSKRARAVKAYRKACCLLCRQAKLTVPAEGKIIIEYEFVRPARHRYDDDGLVARMKYGRDGIADALGIDDYRFVSRHRISDDIVKDGLVRIRLYVPTETECPGEGQQP